MMRFNPRAEYVKGSTLHVADTLSRHPVDPSTPYDVHMVSEIEAYVDQARNAWPVTDDKMDQYREATSDDTILPGVMQYTIDGWPQYRSDISEKYKKYHDVRAHLSVANGLLLYDNQIVIPELYIRDTLEKVHAGHLGITKCRERAKGSVWWHGMSRDIAGIYTILTINTVYDLLYVHEKLYMMLHLGDTTF